MTRRGVRVVEGARLESVFTRKGNVGSNPTLSAIFRTFYFQLKRTASCVWCFQHHLASLVIPKQPPEHSRCLPIDFRVKILVVSVVFLQESWPENRILYRKWSGPNLLLESGGSFQKWITGVFGWTLLARQGLTARLDLKMQQNRCVLVDCRDFKVRVERAG
jgi:hypothetical protein